MDFSRRRFLQNSGVGLGALALDAMASPALGVAPLMTPNRRARAKRVIYLFQAGAPSQIDLFEDKPKVRKHAGEDLRKHVDMKRVTSMTSGQSTYPISPGYFEYKRFGEAEFCFSSILSL